MNIKLCIYLGIGKYNENRIFISQDAHSSIAEVTGMEGSETVRLSDVWVDIGEVPKADEMKMGIMRDMLQEAANDYQERRAAILKIFDIDHEEKIDEE